MCSNNSVVAVTREALCGELMYSSPGGLIIYIQVELEMVEAIGTSKYHSLIFSGLKKRRKVLNTIQGLIKYVRLLISDRGLDIR